MTFGGGFAARHGIRTTATTRMINPIQMCVSNPESCADPSESSSPNMPNVQAMITRRTVTQCNVLATGP
jgi:hypothetical protein